MTAVPSIDELTAEIAAGSPLEQLAAARDLAGRLHARGDELLDHFIDAARTSGSSWSEIGGSLGTSRQAAQQRFAALADPPAGRPPPGLTGAAAEALEAAAQHARALGHQYVRPEHLVLALVEQSDELAGSALAGLGVTPDLVRRAIEQRLGTRPPRPRGSLGIAPQTKRVLELARSTGQSVGHRCPRTEHILLALTSPKLHSPARTLLAECVCGADPGRIRDELSEALLREAPELATALRSRSLVSRVRMRSG